MNAETNQSGTTRRRIALLGGAAVTVLILLAVAIPGVLGGETEWDGELGVLSLPPEMRAVSEVDLAEATSLIGESDLQVTVLPPADWDEAPADGWVPATWVSLNIGQFGRWLDATGAPTELVEAAWGRPGERPISTTVPLEGLGGPSGSRATARMLTSAEGAIRVLRWSPGEAFAGLDVAEDTPNRTDPDYEQAVVDLMEQALAASAVPHRTWAMRMMDTPESPTSFVELFVAAPADPDAEYADEDGDADAMVGLPGINADVTMLADGSLVITRLDATIARWSHPDRPSDLPVGWTAAVSADPDSFVDVTVPEGPLRFAPSGDPLTGVLGQAEDPGVLVDAIGSSGLDDLVVVSGDDEAREVLDTLPPSLCRDVPAGGLDRLLPGNHGPDHEQENLLFPDVPYADYCQWQSPAGAVLVGLLPNGPDGGLLPQVGGLFSNVGEVGGATWGLIDQAAATDVGFEVVWPGSSHRIDGFVRLVDSDDPTAAVIAFVEALAGAVPPDRHNTAIGGIVADYSELASDE